MKPECTIKFTDRGQGPICILRYAKKSHRQHDLLEHGFQSFAFLIPFGESLNATKFVDMISTHYSTENPKTAAIVSAFRQVAEQIGETNGDNP